MINTDLHLKGRFKVQVENSGKIIHETPWKSNLWYEPGMNRLASRPIAECFVAAQKTSDPNQVVPLKIAITGTYTVTSTTVTSGSGGRTWGAGDVGKILLWSNLGGPGGARQYYYSRITAASGSSASLTDAADTPASTSGQTITAASTGADTMSLIYDYGGQPDVGFVSGGIIGLDTTQASTVKYGGEVGDNGTTYGISGDNLSRLKTLRRTYIFESEDTFTKYIPYQALLDIGAPSLAATFSQTGTTITETSPGAHFTTSDIGATFTFLGTGFSTTITAFISSSIVTVATSSTQAAQPAKITYNRATYSIGGISPAVALKETVTGTYTLSNGSGSTGTLIRRVSGARNFTSADIGKRIRFTTAGKEFVISSINSTTEAVANSSDLISSAQSIILYGFTDYTVFGFSHLIEQSTDINIAVTVDTPVRAYISTPNRPADIIRIVYELTLSCSNAITATNGSLVTDPNLAMSGSGAKTGSIAIETFATSEVNTDGTSDLSCTDLEPYNPSNIAFSTNAGSLVVQTNANKVDNSRSSNVSYVPLVASAYAFSSFKRTYTGTFGLADAIRSDWRALLIYNPTLSKAILTYLFDTNQKKTGDNTITVVVTKSWKRILY